MRTSTRNPAIQRLNEVLNLAGICVCLVCSFLCFFAAANTTA